MCRYTSSQSYRMLNKNPMEIILRPNCLAANQFQIPLRSSKEASRGRLQDFSFIHKYMTAPTHIESAVAYSALLLSFVPLAIMLFVKLKTDIPHFKKYTAIHWCSFSCLICATLSRLFYGVFLFMYPDFDFDEYNESSSVVLFQTLVGLFGRLTLYLAGFLLLQTTVIRYLRLSMCIPTSLTFVRFRIFQGLSVVLFILVVIPACLESYQSDEIVYRIATFTIPIWIIFFSLSELVINVWLVRVTLDLQSKQGSSRLSLISAQRKLYSLLVTITSLDIISLTVYGVNFLWKRFVSRYFLEIFTSSLGSIQVLFAILLLDMCKDGITRSRATHKHINPTFRMEKMKNAAKRILKGQNGPSTDVLIQSNSIVTELSTVDLHYIEPQAAVQSSSFEM